MKLKRERSILTGGIVEELSVIKDFPVFTGGTTNNKEDDLYHDLTFDICKQTGIIQLRNLIDPDILYSIFHSEALGDVWEEHHNLFSKLIIKYQDNNSILEIGGSDSRMAIRCLDETNIKKWTIIDPNIRVESFNPKIKYNRDYFNKDKIKELDFDMIVHSHVLEHIYDPKLFLQTLNDNMNDGDYHIFSIPNLYVYLKNKYINALTFEHTLFLTEEFMDYLLSCYGFVIDEKSYYSNHSIFYVTRKQKTDPLKLPVRYQEHKNMYLAFFNYYKEFIDRLNEELKKTTKDVYLFGGHIFSQYLIALGLDISRIKCVLDNSKLKNGKRLYGTDLIIKFPDDIELNWNSLIVLKAGSYENEIRMQLFCINPSINFFE